jgi:Fic family protein
LPDLSLLLYTYVRKEAVLSSQIEGTQSSLSDLLLYENDEAPGAPIEDVQEVSNYVAAMNHGLERMRSGFPLSLRLIREIHEILLSQGRGSGKQPGEFRRSQNWIGGSRPGNAVFVPPPPELLAECLNQFELFLHDEQTGLPLLIRAGLVHVQFETIHPFLDGNGRLGRLLITFLLCAQGALREPILYLSLYFKTNRAAYYELLDRVRTKGDWEAWLDFFLVGVRDTAEQAASASREILDLFNKDRKKIETLGRPAASVLRVFQHMQRNPIIAIPSAAKRIGISAPTVAKSLGHMINLGILEETTGRERHRLFVYRRYLNILNEGTEPLR